MSPIELPYPVVKSYLTVEQSGVHDANSVLMNDWPITIVEDVNLLEICLTWLTLSWFLFMFFRNLEFSPNIMDFSFRQIQKLNLSQILAQIKKTFDDFNKTSKNLFVIKLGNWWHCITMT